jgi:cytochrome c
MVRVTMMDSSTPYCKKTIDPWPGQGWQRRAFLQCMASAALGAVGGQLAAHAQVEERPAESESATPDAHVLRLQREGDDVLLSAAMAWELPSLAHRHSGPLHCRSCHAA